MAKKQQVLPQRKIPMRQCLGCNEHKPKVELVRILRTPEGEITLDLTGKKSGRGAYLCKNPACLKKLRKSRREFTTPRRRTRGNRSAAAGHCCKC